MRARHEARGFTLLEVVVALGIGLAVVTALYASFSTVLRGRSALEGDYERNRAATRFVEVFSKEIESAYYSQKNPATMFTGRLSYAESATGLLEFTAFSYGSAGSALLPGDLIAVRYSVSKGEGGSQALFREVWNPYARRAKDAIPAFRTEVIDNVTGFDLSFYNGRDWVPVWDASLEKGAPIAVRAALTIAEGEGRTEVRALARTMVR